MPSKGVVICVVMILLCWKPAFLHAEAGTVTFKILIDPALLAKALPDSLEDPGTDLVPCAISFVQMYTFTPGGLRRPPALREWYQSVSQRADPQEVSISIKDGQLEPRLFTLRTGDSIVQGDFRGSLRFQMSRNPSFGVLGMKGAQYRFSLPEPRPIKFDIDLAPNLVGHLTVTDHPYAAISDKEGSVRFTGMPTGMEIPMLVDCPLVDRDLYEFTSPDADIQSNGRFGMTLPESGESKIEIRIVKKTESRH